MYTPVILYRLQFNPEFKFCDAKEIIPYLKALGISDIYASPITKARPGSMHGYDVIEQNLLNPELGSPEDFDVLISELKKYNLGWIQDIVPNHMAYSGDNQMLIDVLENGNNSRFYNFFDVEWNHPHASVRQRVLAPFLGKFFQEVLENFELQLKYDLEGLNVNYYSLRLPIKMESYVEILSKRLYQLRNKLGKNHPDMIKYLGVLYVLKSLPSSPEELDERYDQIKFIKGMLWELYSGNEVIRGFIDNTLTLYNGDRKNRESINELEKLLVDQNFRLAYWKVATDEINYRRFFTVNELITLRMEREEVFNRSHLLLFKLIREGKINGIRVDHIDGLYDPKRYLSRLRDKARECYIIVEKILDAEEELPIDWQIQGTTGYEYANFVNGLFCNHENERKITSIYVKFSKLSSPIRKIMADCKRLIVQKRMAGDVERLAFIIEAISSKDRYGIDLTMHGLKEALEDILTYFPIYRTYVDSFTLREQDKSYLEWTINKVKEKNPVLSNEFDYIGNLLLLKFRDDFTAEQKNTALDFVMKFQQLTGPLMAKGFEDTFMYVYNRHISLNEVGGNPEKFGTSPQAFHRFNFERNEKWKYTLNTISTHDTKRGEDVRARINVISEFPAEWNTKLKTWAKFNTKFKKSVKGLVSPDRNDEYLIYQTLIGSYPFLESEMQGYTQRIKEYTIKAIREAKVHTAWIKPNDDYEKACLNFVENILVVSDDNLFLRDFLPFQKMIAFYGIFNSLSQTLLKYTSPGIPDIYQGTELWDLFLVDPDNRRKVNYNLRLEYIQKMISEHTQPIYKDYLLHPETGQVKLFLVWKLLQARNLYYEIYNGEYIPVNVSGKFASNIVSFARKMDNNIIIAIAPRLITDIVKPGRLPLGAEIWEDTVLNIPFEISNWVDLITGQVLSAGKEIRIGDILSDFPVALIMNSEMLE